MPNNVTKKTASAPNIWYAALIVLAGIAVVTFAALYHDAPTAVLRTTHETFELAVADTNAARQKGLGDRANMPVNQGMLFEFGAPSNQCFWMKDMHFALDMIWLDSSKHVLQVHSNVSPATYPQTFCAPNTQYVIELNAGRAAGAGIVTGQLLAF